MTLTPQQLRALRKRRQAADAEAEWAFQERVVGPLTGFAEPVAPLPVPCGWMETGQIGGGFTYCLACAPSQPTAGHVAVYPDSYFATKPCLVCGRHLEDTIG